MDKWIYDYVVYRPDMSHSTLEPDRISDNPYDCHYTSIKRVVGYLMQELEKMVFCWII